MKKLTALAIALILAYAPLHAIAAENAAASSIDLTVEVRSPRQAIITLTDSRLNALVQQNTDYFATWCVYFGADGQFRLSAEIHDGNPNDAHFILEKERTPYNWTWFGEGTPVIAARHPHRPSGSPVPLEKIYMYPSDFKQIENGFVWEVSMPEGESVDFTSDTPFTVEFELMKSGEVQDGESFEVTFEAGAVVDMRNFGQEYDIGLLWEDFSLHGMAERVYGLTFEQAEQLYFSPPQSRYLTAHAEIEGVYYGEDDTRFPFKVDVYELVCFDESGNITRIVDKIVGADRENWGNGTDEILSWVPNFTHYYPGVKLVYGNNDSDIPVSYLCAADPEVIMHVLSNHDVQNIDDYIAEFLNGSGGWIGSSADIERHD